MVRPKFKIGDEVWVVDNSEEIRTECPYCKGFGLIKAQTKDGLVFETKCPICDGSGGIKADKWVLAYNIPRTIIGYAVERIAGEEAIRYKLDTGWMGFSHEETRLFKTKKEAEKATKILNNLSINKTICEKRRIIKENLTSLTE